MSIKSQYIAAVAKETGRYAVWQPGDPANVGDYGVTSKTEFRKLGNLTEFDINFRCETTNPAHWELTSAGITTVLADAKGELGTAHVTGARARLRITFGHANSLFVRASDSVWSQIANLREVASVLQEDERWDFTWRLVAGVRRSRSLVVLLATKANTAVSVEGEAPALQQFQLGGIGAHGRVAVAGEGAFTFMALDCPLIMGLAKIRRFPYGRSMIKYSVGDGLSDKFEPFEILDARCELSNFDDQ